MRCPYCESGTNDIVPMNQAVEYSGIEMAVNRQGMLRVRVLDNDGSFTTQDIIEIRNCPLCGLSPEFRYNVEWDFVDGLS